MMQNGDLSDTGFPPDFEAEEIATIRAVAPYTMTSTERIHALIRAVTYVVTCGIPGDLVECGVWKGGSVMAMALTLLRLQDNTRNLYLYDTFAGMTAPEDRDVDYEGMSAERLGEAGRYVAVQEQVEAVVLSTGYDRSRIHFVPGRVEDTIPAQAPGVISLLRLDTDWYASTRHELAYLFPRLAPGGVLIVDDYGHWQGARQALDEYVAQKRLCLFLHRIDYTGRIGIKT